MPDTIDVVATYEAMLQLMQPGETVARAIKRLGGGKSAASVQRRQAWKNKKAQQMDTGSTADEASGDKLADGGSKPQKSDLIEMIGYADKLLSLNGEMGIYQDTFEKLSFKVKNMSETASVSRPVDGGLDMFADDITSTAAVSKQQTATSSSVTGACFNLQ